MTSILIIDDHLMLADVLRVALEDFYTVFTAQNGMEAIEVLDRCSPDVVITDYAMPGMTGIEVIEYIVKSGQSQCRKKPKIILYSSRMDKELEQRGREAGADVCLEKPFDLSEIMEIIERLIKL